MNVKALEVNYHAMLMQSPDPCALLDAGSGVLIDVNDKAVALWGLAREHLLGMALVELCAPPQPPGQAPAELLRAEFGRAVNGDGVLFQTALRDAGGAPTPCEVLLMRVPVPGPPLLHMRVIDIARRIRNARLLDGQGRVLELVARGAPLGEILERLIRLIEGLSDGVLCSVLLLDEDGVSVRPAAGPSLPPAYMAALDGLQIGPAVGSCGTAMYTNQTVIVPDILLDPLWAPYKTLATPHGLRACWSTPIAPDQQQVLGSFAMYYRAVRSPSEEDMHLIGVATHLAGIAIERTRRERELALHRTHLEVLVAARTAELTEAIARADQINLALSSALDTLSLAQEQLVRRDKMAALGALVAGVAHELNTPIGNSLVVASVLAERIGTLAARVAGGLRRAELERFLSDAAEAGDLLVRNLQRAAMLVTGFKQIAVDQASSERRAFSLAALLAELAAPLRTRARGAGVRLDLALDTGLDTGLDMDSYPGPLAQVVSELFENCLAHAFADGRSGTVRLGAALRTHDLVAVTLEDDGAGMTAQVQQRVYDPFFTTRMGAGRSGLGLHVVHNIVSGVLGGRIDLHSAPGHGACFTLLLPRVAPQAADAPAAPRAP